MRSKSRLISLAILIGAFALRLVAKCKSRLISLVILIRALALGPATKPQARFISLAILIGAFALRLVYLLQTKDLPFCYQPLLDNGYFDQWADFKLHAGWLDAIMPFRESMYAFFLAGIYSLFRHSFTLVRLVQCLMGAATALMIYSIGKRTYDLLAGAVAGLVFALYAPAIFFASEINEASLAVLLLVASAYALARAQDTRPYLGSGISGLLAGAAFLTRFTTIVALPAWLAHLLLSRSPKLRRASILLLATFMVVPICYHAFLIRTDQHGVFPVRSSWQAFLGCGATGGKVQMPTVEISLAGEQGAYRALAASDRIDGQRDAIRFARIEDSNIQTGIEAQRHWQRRTWEDFLADPGRYLSNYLSKLAVFWGPSEPPANMDFRFMSRYSFLLRTRILAFPVIACLGLVGLAAAGRRRSLHLGTFILPFSLLASVYLVTDLDKLLVVPFLSVFAGYTVARIAEHARRRRLIKAASYGVAALVLGLLLQHLPGYPLDQARNLVVVGDAYNGIAVFEKAEECYREAIRLSPDLPEAYVSLAGLYGSTGKPEKGVEVLTDALQKVKSPRLNLEKASLLAMMDRPDEALSELRGLSNSYPYEPKFHQLMGLSFMAKGETERAREELQKELDYVGGGFITYSALGRAELESGDLSEAVDHLEAALSFNPYNASTAGLLAEAYSQLGQYLKACDILGKILSVDPGNMPMRFKVAVCLYKAGRPGDALMHFKELQKYDPGNADILVNMGTVYAGMDSLGRAIEMWERALVLDPHNQMALDNLRLAREQNE